MHGEHKFRHQKRDCQIVYMRRGWVHFMHVPVCCGAVQCSGIDEMSEQTRQGFPLRGRPRQCNSNGVISSSISSSITPHHWPGHPHVPNPLYLYKPAIQQHRIQPHYCRQIQLSDSLFEIISLYSHTRTVFLHKKNEWFWKKAKLIIHMKCQSCGWADHPGVIAGRGCRTNCESEPETGCLWINQLYLFSPPPPIALLCSLSSLLNTPPCFLNTHTYTHRKAAHRVAKEMVTSFSTAAICVERVPVRRAERRMILKINAWIAVCTDWEGWTDRSRENRAGWKARDQDMLLLVLQFLLQASSGNLRLWYKQQCEFSVLQVMGYQEVQSQISAAELIKPLGWVMKPLQNLRNESSCLWPTTTRQTAMALKTQIYMPFNTLH